MGLRYPRGEAEGVAAAQSSPQTLEIGRGEMLREGERVAFLGYGYGVPVALGAAELLESEHGIEPTVADARFAKPLDAELIASLAAEHDVLVTVEENVLAGGFGSAVVEHLSDNDLAGEARVLRIGLPDRYVTHGKPALLREEVGLTPEAVAGEGGRGRARAPAAPTRRRARRSGRGRPGPRWSPRPPPKPPA